MFENYLDFFPPHDNCNSDEDSIINAASLTSSIFSTADVLHNNYNNNNKNNNNNNSNSNEGDTDAELLNLCEAASSIVCCRGIMFHMSANDNNKEETANNKNVFRPLRGPNWQLRSNAMVASKKGAKEVERR